MRSDIRTRAQEALRHFEYANEKWHLKRNCTACQDTGWVHDLVYAAHDDGDWFPDDWRYEFIVEALRALEDADDPDDVQLEPDVYNHELTKWIHSNLKRLAYADDVLAEGYEAKTLTDLLGYAQLREKEEVLEAVKRFLLERCDEEDEEETEDDEPST